MVNTHYMVFTGQLDLLGEEVWACQQCRKRTTVKWKPTFTVNIIVPGDPDALHVYGKGTEVFDVKEEMTPEAREFWEDIFRQTNFWGDA